MSFQVGNIIVTRLRLYNNKKPLENRKDLQVRSNPYSLDFTFKF